MRDVGIKDTIMGYKFIGEGIPELKEIPADQRRKRFLSAVAKSFLYLRTWVGLLLFCLIAYVGVNFSHQIANAFGELLSTPKRREMFVSMALSTLALFALYRGQIGAIKKEIRKK